MIETNSFHDFKIFSNAYLFKNLNKETLEAIYHSSAEIILNKNDSLILEGEESHDIFIVLEGNFVASKFEKKRLQEHFLTTFMTSDVIGEIGVLENEKRTASVRANSYSRVRKISFSQLTSLAKNEEKASSLFEHLSQNLAKKLKETLAFTVESLQNQVEEEKKRNLLAKLFIYIIGGLCVFTLSLNFLVSMINTDSSTFIVAIMMSIMSLFVLTYIKSTHLPIKEFGLTFNNWKKAVFEAVLFSLGLILILIFIKYLLIQNVKTFHHLKLIQVWQPQDAVDFMGFHLPPFYIWFLSIFTYTFIGCFLQEFVIRAGIQASLNHFLTGKRKKMIVLFLPNIIFSTFHITYEGYFFSLVFLPGLFFGWLFIRHGNLIGSTLAHIILGVGVLYFIGLP